jgi:hypothetical protein
MSLLDKCLFESIDFQLKKSHPNFSKFLKISLNLNLNFNAWNLVIQIITEIYYQYSEFPI